MDTLKSCDNCINYPTIATSSICVACSDASDIYTPYPLWEPSNELPFFSGTMHYEIEEEEDVVNHPSHYTTHPSGVECIQITEHMNFCLGNAMKYIWRAGEKHDSPIEDLKKAKWYIEREIQRLEKNEKV